MSDLTIEKDNVMAAMLANSSVNTGGETLASAHASTTADYITISGAYDNVGPTTGYVSNGGTTDDLTPALHGQVMHGDGFVLKIYLNREYIGSAIVEEGGGWVFQLSEPLAADTKNDFQVILMDPASSDVLISDTYTLFTTAPDIPDAPVLDIPGTLMVADNAGEISGLLVNGGATDDTTPEFSGEGQTPGEIITILANDVVLGSARVEPDGKWSFTPSEELDDGSYHFTLTVTDVLGRTSEASDPFTLNIDTVIKQASIISVRDDSGQLNNGDVTDDSSPVMVGYSAPGADVHIHVYDEGGRKMYWESTIADDNGIWSWQPSTPFPEEGQYSFSLSVVDTAGNIWRGAPEFTIELSSGVSQTQELKLDELINPVQQELFIDDSQHSQTLAWDRGDVPEMKTSDLNASAWQSEDQTAHGSVDNDIYSQRGLDIEQLIPQNIQSHDV